MCEVAGRLPECGELTRSDLGSLRPTSASDHVLAAGSPLAIEAEAAIAVAHESCTLECRWDCSDSRRCFTPCAQHAGRLFELAHRSPFERRVEPRRASAIRRAVWRGREGKREQDRLSIWRARRLRGRLMGGTWRHSRRRVDDYRLGLAWRRGDDAGRGRYFQWTLDNEFWQSAAIATVWW